MKRDLAINQLRTAGEAFDVLIIGGGATGLGAAVDAAARGYRVALIEQSDFAKGTSSRATKLLHGGVRYLKQGNISLVLEALRERGLLIRNAPHLTHDMSFVIPNYKWWEKSFYGVGLKFYDRLAGKLSLGRSEILSRRETIDHLPTIESAGLCGGVLYHDGQFDDARLALNLAQTAQTLGAVLANYCRCVRLVKKDGLVRGVIAQDVETGDDFEIAAAIVINATGVFVDAVRQMDEPAARPIVAVSQGIHLVLPRRFLPGDTALMIPKTEDGRVLFALPWHDRVVVGTTDTPVASAVLEPRAQAEERDFVMTHARHYLANDPVDSDVLSVFAGLRPLVNVAGAGSTAALARDHTIQVSPSRLITITGGKWTTYRHMAEDVIDCAERATEWKHRPSVTETLPIHGWTHAGGTAVPHLKVYGSDAAAIVGLMAREPALGTALHSHLPYRQAEVIWHARHEMARTVEDVLARRTRALLLDAAASIEAAPMVARLLARELHHGDNWINAQVNAYSSLAAGYVYAHPASRANPAVRACA